MHALIHKTKQKNIHALSKKKYHLKLTHIFEHSMHFFKYICYKKRKKILFIYI